MSIEIGSIVKFTSLGCSYNTHQVVAINAAPEKRLYLVKQQYGWPGGDFKYHLGCDEHTTPSGLILDPEERYYWTSIARPATLKEWAGDKHNIRPGSYVKYIPSEYKNVDCMYVGYRVNTPVMNSEFGSYLVELNSINGWVGGYG